MAKLKKFRGEIRVASRIVDYLSSGLYESPAACLKELINNSYDASARTVSVFVKPDANRIIIEDDGTGMTREEFEKHFKLISESHKRDDSDKTESGRPKIGKIGIGFIAANEICDRMEIISTRARSREKIHVTIDFAKMRMDPSERRRSGSKFAEGDYDGQVLEAPAADHYTHIFLKQVRGEAKKMLVAAEAHKELGVGRCLYGLSAKTVAGVLADPGIRSWSEFDAYSKTMLHVALNIPVKYADDWMPRQHKEKVREFVSGTSRLKFDVFYDGTELRKPILFNPVGGKSRVTKFKFRGKHVAATGYFYAQHGVVHPQNLNGLLIRIRNAAVGEYDSSFLDYPSSLGTIFQRWISAEIWADDRLEDAMNIDRKTLRTSHAAFVELQEAVHGALRSVIQDARAMLHGSETRARNKVKVSRELEMIEDLVSDQVSAPVARSIRNTWREAKSDPKVGKKLLAKRSVTQLYKLVVEVAAETLKKSDADRFLKEFTRRLGK